MNSPIAARRPGAPPRTRVAPTPQLVGIVSSACGNWLFRSKRREQKQSYTVPQLVAGVNAGISPLGVSLGLQVHVETELVHSKMERTRRKLARVVDDMAVKVLRTTSAHGRGERESTPQVHTAPHEHGGQ